MNTYISGISYYLPSDTLSNEDINKDFPEWEAEKISNKTGIKNRHIASKNEFASDMAINAANKLFDEYKIKKEGIEFIIYCTQSPDYFLPSTACIIQQRLGLPTSIGAFDFNLGCSGYVYGLSLAKGLISSGMVGNVLLLMANTYSKYIHPLDKSNKTIFGDAASATYITSTEGFWNLGEFVWGTDGSGAGNLIVKNNGIRYRNEEGVDIYDEENKFVKNDDYLYMNGGEIFNFTSKAVPKLISNVLLKNNLTPDKIDIYVLHQANKYMLEFIRRKMKVEKEKFIYNLEKTGNTVSNTIPIAIKDTCFDAKYEKIILAGFGVGYSWGGCLLTKV